MQVFRNLVAIGFLLGVSAASAQQDSLDSQPYAAINRSAINYTGPGRETARDLAGPELKIGLIAPLQGERKTEGEALVAAAQMAVEDESATPLPGRQRLTLVVRDEAGLWGRASSEIVKLAVDDRAVALITSSDGRAAHLSEQVGNRLGVPIVTLASDATTTQINIPWLFRVVPNDAAQASAFAESIYRERGFQKVLLISEGDHDGRAGAEEFERAVRRLQVPAPARIEISLPLHDVSRLLKESRAQEVEAVVMWTSAATAAQLLEGFAGTRARIFLCRKAIEEPLLSAASGRQEIWTVAARDADPGSEGSEFPRRYRKRMGSAPSLAASGAYDAVQLIVACLRESGPNRARLRDALASHGDYHGVAGVISFDGAGNSRAEVVLIPLQRLDSRLR